MSIQADRYLIKKSTTPTHMNRETGEHLWDGVDFPANSAQYDDNLVSLTGEQVDRWLDNQTWFPMISPFLPKQESSVDRPLTDSEKMDYLNDNRQGLFHPSAKVIDTPDGLILREKAISSGVSSYGYDVKCADEFKIFTNINSKTIDPKNFDPKIFVDHKGPTCIIPPNSFALARTVEWFKIPRNVLTICLGKSTYARCGIIVNVTPLEPEWEGHVTLEFSNTTSLPAIIYANEGVAQMLFFEGEEEPLVTYKDRGGKYQGQSGVVVPRMK